MLSQSHSDYCPCNKNWEICCDNPANYSQESEGSDCDSDIRNSERWPFSINNVGEWERDRSISPQPSPGRDEDDWFTQEKNPTLQEPERSVPMYAPALPEDTLLYNEEEMSDEILVQRKAERQGLIPEATSLPKGITGSDPSDEIRLASFNARTSASWARNASMKARTQAASARRVARNLADLSGVLYKPVL